MKQVVNPYLKDLSTVDFLEKTYLLMLNKVKRIKEIEEKRKGEKLPLPLLKEKFEESSKILQALGLLSDSIDYSTEMGKELADILNNLGIYLTKANIEKGEESIRNYNIVISILEGFLGK